MTASVGTMDNPRHMLYTVCLFQSLFIAVLSVLCGVLYVKHAHTSGVREIYAGLAETGSVGLGNAGPLQVARTYGSEEAKRILSIACKYTGRYAFDGEYRVVELERGGFAFLNGNVSDVLTLSFLAKIEGDFPAIAAWRGPPGMSVDDMRLTADAVHIEYHTKDIEHAIQVIPWAKGSAPRSGLIGYDKEDCR